MIKPIIFILFMFLVFSSCSTTDSRRDKIDNICRQEPCYEGPFEPPWISGHDYGLEFIDEQGSSLTYDNRVLETENVLTFSDASSDQVKIRYAQMTEVSFTEIKEIFYVKNSAELGILDRYTKIRIFSNRNKNHPHDVLENGFLLYSLDSPHWGSLPDSDPDFYSWYQRVVKHETMHVMQFKLIGAYDGLWAWFTEGIAEYISGGAFTPISCWPEVVEWRQDPDHVNPVSLANLYQIPENTWGEHYALFGLAVRYLLDPAGKGRTIQDVKAMFADIGRGMKFEIAFELHMGMSMEYYEAHFWEMMQVYLPASCNEAARIQWGEQEWRIQYEEPVPGYKF